ncbi:pentatricopeptide repeat-containing protein At2g29760, chloroplastic-like [Solanum stenotomum]|uniref:pentatricopeptide repeat-containing protein At2g29760, chloroplastic-like n=1 Tax=Solanum stenotomum TaxID=172797 RepID=UPI0020D0FC5E|nr:pentatricopeptide repeat-containing protein At2g29760, chloroplastic-like [Solanum stenotomum]
MCSSTIRKLLKLATNPHLFLIQNCTNMKHLKKFHGHFITNGLSNDTLFLSVVLSFTALFPTGNLAYAHLVFNQIDSPNTFMFNTMIRGYGSSSNPSEVMSFYVKMLRYGFFPNHYTYPFVIKAVCRTQNYILGEALHCSVIKFGHVLDLHIANSLLHMYAKFGFFVEIMYLFDEMPEPDVVSWNVVIDDFVKNGCFDEVLAAVNEMCWNGVEPNAVTLLGLVSCSLKMGDFGLGKLIHLYIMKRGIHMSENLGNGLIDMYAKFGDMESAEKLFDRMQMKTVFSWTSLLDGFIQKGELERAGVVFSQMPKDTTAWNVMLSGYSEAGDMSSAETIFRAMPDRDLVSWNTMILGYTQNKMYMKSLELLRDMFRFGLKPDRITLIGLFSVCGYAGVLHIGEAIHSFMEKQNIKEEEVEVALLDMYSKCGDPEKALTVFYTIRRKKSVLAWTNMIVGLAMNGLANEALMLFHQMCDEGTGPNEITYLGVLCACSYAGLVKEGKWLFNAMSKVHGITPRSEHYGCMVDLLGRAGLLEEAEMFIQDMPEKAAACIWGALLGACRMHGEVQMGERIAKIVTQMDPYHSGRYILLSNIYAAENRWFDAEKVREKMKTEGIHKTPGFSLVEMKGEMHQFIVT